MVMVREKEGAGNGFMELGEAGASRGSENSSIESLNAGWLRVSTSISILSVFSSRCVEARAEL